ncbi:MAG TPA: glycosyltransferase family 1 protein [Pyrinomonadaceae bacterium]|nr:glycosyltransferase family 1 protein [Pyrinomonadaceae bacterium]
MRILYDGGASNERGAGGIKRYFANLIKRLPPDFEPHLTWCRPKDGTEPAHPQLRVHRFQRFRPQRVSLKMEKLFFNRVQKVRHFDLAHPTYYTLLTQQEISHYRYPVVLTVWDMIHELFPELDSCGVLAAQKKRAVESARVVLCISENTKNDLLTHYKIDENKILVTHLASDLNSTLIQGSEITPTRRYFLYVGARAGYKNFERLLSAFSSVAKAAPEVILCAVGEPFNDREKRSIAELGLAGKVENYSRVSDGLLAALYRDSIALVYPSLYEGFGIPPLEAMQCGTPVVAANRSSIPEVVGDAAILFDPYHEEELAEILVALVRQPEIREPLISRGTKRASQFSWERTAQQTLNVYAQLVR